ncbi:MAG: ABC transporter substrate-binding protein [Spirochaetales bacterium]|nr:ABC transporter substrate-binding protein [Spirochaetales bacterium]
MKGFRRVLVCLSVVLFLLAVQSVWAGGEKEGAVTGNVIKIGYTAPFTGPAAELGTNGWRGVQLALEDINKTGVTVGGVTYKFDIVRYDSVCEPTQAVSNLRKMAMEDKVVAIIGDHCSSCCMGIAPLCDEFKIPGITIECAADGVTSPGHDFYFRMRPSMGLMAPLLTPKIMDLYNPKSIGFLCVNDDYGRSFAQGFKDNFAKLGIKTAIEIYFERGSTDHMAFLNQIRGAKPDIVFYVGTTPEGAMILKQAKELGVTPGIKFIGSEEMSEMELVELAGADAVEGTYSVALWGSVPADLEARVREQFNASMHYAILFGYDALTVIKMAIEKSQSLDPVVIRDAIKKTDYQGLQGHIKFEDFDNYKNQGRYEPAFILWSGGKRHAQ